MESNNDSKVAYYLYQVLEYIVIAFQWIIMKCQQLWSCLSSTKFLLLVNTTLFVITGLALLVLGTGVLFFTGKYYMFVEDMFILVPAFLIAMAGVIFITAILGYHGVSRNKYHYVVAYITLLVTILVFEISISVIGFVTENRAWQGSVIVHTMYDSFKHYKDNNMYYPIIDPQKVWDDMQRDLKCCGFYNREDWGSQMPLSCCSEIGAISPYQCLSYDSYYNGCYTTLGWTLETCTFVIGATTAAVASLQGIIILIAIGLAYRIKSQQDMSYRRLLESSTDRKSKANYQSIPGHNVCPSEPTGVNC